MESHCTGSVIRTCPCNSGNGHPDSSFSRARLEKWVVCPQSNSVPEAAQGWAAHHPDRFEHRLFSLSMSPKLRPVTLCLRKPRLLYFGGKWRAFYRWFWPWAIWLYALSLEPSPAHLAKAFGSSFQLGCVWEYCSCYLCSSQVEDFLLPRIKRRPLCLTVRPGSEGRAWDKVTWDTVWWEKLGSRPVPEKEASHHQSSAEWAMIMLRYRFINTSKA